MKSLTSQQLAFLQCGARYTKDVVRNGRVIRRGAPVGAQFEPHAQEKAMPSSRGLVLEAQIAAQRDADRRKAKDGIAEMQAILAASNVRVSHVKPGRARHAGELNRKRAGAMSMGYFKGSGFGG